MKAASLKEIRTGLAHATPAELLDYCLRLTKHKKENKELLTYLLFHATDEQNFIQAQKKEMEQQFKLVNRRSHYFMKKEIQKILSTTKKNIRFSKNKQTEVELLLHFCTILKQGKWLTGENLVIQNIWDRQRTMLGKCIRTLHEDLQYDYKEAFEKL